MEGAARLGRQAGITSCHPNVTPPRPSLPAADGAPPPNRTHWNALLSSYAEARDVGGAAAAYRRMSAAGLRPDCSTLVALLRVAFHARLGLAAVRAVRAEMKRHNVQPNIQLSTAMLCCLRHVRPDPEAPPLQLRPAAGSASTAAASPGDGSSQQLQLQPQQLQPAEQQQQPQLQHEGGEGPDESAACLAEATAVFAAMRRQWGARRQALDLRAYNSLLLVQLAAGDYAGVLATVEAIEGEEALRPDGTTLGTAIAACRAAGLHEREQEFRRLMASSRLLGALGGDEAAPPGARGGGGSFTRRRGSHSGRGGSGTR